MNGLSGASSLPRTFESNSHYLAWNPEPSGLLDDDWVHLNYESHSDHHPKTSRSTRTKQSKKRLSRNSKTKRSEHFHGYVLQVIGLVCFILAAVTSYEPLTGIGFTLIVLGYNKNASTDCKINLSSRRQMRENVARIEKGLIEKESAAKNNVLTDLANNDDDDSSSQ